MQERIWDKHLTERDKEVLKASGYGTLGGFGKRPALLVIDASWAFCGEKREPIMEAIKRWPNACGDEAWDAVAVMRKLIDASHDKGVPVIYTTGAYRKDGWDAGSWLWKVGRMTEQQKADRAQGIDGDEIVHAIAPGPKDIVIHKQKPSGFSSTEMVAYLNLLGCDSVIVTGGTTSGCVRATVVDAFSLNYRVAVVEDGCFDRLQSSHALSLCDMNAKYSDVVPHETVLDFLQSMTPGLYPLPSGV